MKIFYHLKKKRSLKENVKIILPMMFDNMMEYKTSVAGHPRMKTSLHRMRITGKPMRYIMEIMQPTFGKEFTNNFHEIKNIIELMGEIHDGDVFISELREHLHELRSFNRIKNNKNQKISTSAVTKLMVNLKEKRSKDYNLLCSILRKWGKENFRKKLINSMNSERVNEINYFKRIK